MKPESLSRLRKPLRILLSVSLILAGVCLMLACLGIYRSGGSQPFSRESVAAAFRPISIPVYLCLGLAIVTCLAERFLPQAEEKQPPVRQLRMALARIQQRTDLALCPPELRQEVQALRADRRLHSRIAWTVLILSSVLFLTYGLNGRNFHSTHINSSMIRAMVWLIPCAAVPFLCGIFVSRKALTSMETELELLKKAPKEARITPPRPRSSRRTLLLRTGLLALGLVILIYGFFAGGTADVLTKAVNICTECVGLG